MNRRNFLKGLSALAAVPIAIKDVAKSKELTNIEKAKKIDEDFSSPFLYVEALENINQSDIVYFCNTGRKHSYNVVKVPSSHWTKAAGIACQDVKKGQFFFIQTVGHCTLPVK